MFTVAALTCLRDMALSSARRGGGGTIQASSRGQQCSNQANGGIRRGRRGIASFSNVVVAALGDRRRHGGVVAACLAFVAADKRHGMFGGGVDGDILFLCRRGMFRLAGAATRRMTATYRHVFYATSNGIIFTFRGS